MSTYIQEIRSALAGTITEEDLKELIETTRKKALHNEAIVAELKALPENNGKAALSVMHINCLHQLWRIVMLGTFDPEKYRIHPHPFISLETSVHWMSIIFSTLDRHFSGEIAEVGKINALRFFCMFIRQDDEEIPPANNINFPISCAAQFLFYSLFSLTWLDSSVILSI